MGTMWRKHEVLKIACQHSIEAAPPDRGETSVMAQVRIIYDIAACIYNRVHLRTLKYDRSLVEKLRDHLSVTACRSRDRMDLDSMLEISSEEVRWVITDNVNTIINYGSR